MAQFPKTELDPVAATALADHLTQTNVHGQTARTRADRRNWSGNMSGTFVAGAGTGGYPLAPGRGNVVGATGAGAALGVISITPGDIAAVTKWEVEAEIYSNTVDPGAGLFSVRLMPVTGVNGATSGVVGITLGTAVAGSNTTATVLGPSAMQVLKSGLFTLTAGLYTLYVLATGANVATNSGVVAVGRLMAEVA